MAPDLNVLLAASRTDHPQFKPANAWLKQAAGRCNSGGSIELLPMVVAGFLRLSTNPKIFATPTPMKAAVKFIDSLVAIPGIELAELGREWPNFRQLCTDLDLAANSITDAWIAAAVRTIGGHLVTFDRDFKRYLGASELTILAAA